MSYLTEILHLTVLVIKQILMLRSFKKLLRALKQVELDMPSTT